MGLVDNDFYLKSTVIYPIYNIGIFAENVRP